MPTLPGGVNRRVDSTGRLNHVSELRQIPHRGLATEWLSPDRENSMRPFAAWANRRCVTR
jgi:hypothetical protein